MDPKNYRVIVTKVRIGEPEDNMFKNSYEAQHNDPSPDFNTNRDPWFTLMIDCDSESQAWEYCRKHYNDLNF